MRKLGYSTPTVYNWIDSPTGAKPSHVADIAALLGVTPELLTSEYAFPTVKQLARSEMERIRAAGIESADPEDVAAPAMAP